MANHKQAEKRHKQSLRRRARNVKFKKKIKIAVRSVLLALEDNNIEAAQTSLRKAASVLARGASKNVIPNSRASRKLARLSMKVHSAKSA